jgi:hypothetical protein
VSIPQPPQPVKLIMSLLSAHPRLIDEVCTDLVSRFGPLDFMSELLPFRYTRYYEFEMGADLRRRLVSFQRLIAPDTMPVPMRRRSAGSILTPDTLPCHT